MSSSSSHLAVVRTLLDALHEEQSAAPDELQEDRDLRRMREDLERIALQLAHDEMITDLSATTDAELEVLLDFDGDWIDRGDGLWRVRDVTPSASGAAGAAHLKELRRLCAGSVVPERDLEYLVQLLRDPAYNKVRRCCGVGTYS